jgi:MarR family transcriptional regulator, organic hydroperoxide resistance regulator
MTATSAPPAAEFAAAWNAFTRATRRARSRAADPLDPSGLTLAQFQLLEALLPAREMTVSELAAAAGVAAPTATRMLDALERAGVAERTPCAADRRVVKVSLTQAGRGTVGAAAERVEAARSRVRESLTPDEQVQAAALLRKLAGAIGEL